MKTVSMSGSLRGNVGKKDAKKNRVEGKVPCVLYGGKEQLHFVVEEKAISTILFTPDTYLVEFVVDGKSYNAILQDVQYHPVSDVVLHADFLETVPGKAVKVSIPLVMTGTPKGVLRGGRLIKKVRKIKVKGLIEHIPDQIELDIAKLDIGSSIKASDIKLKNLEMLDPPSTLIVTVLSARAVVAETEEEEEKAEGTVGQEPAAE
ncbi:MAG: 50S ribosomal protein L25 [Bacteroidales bacterium]|nr:50S ribosomal protein L25 [Bacteroidales bacterium]MDZ4203313.1 50S ribosomal protein L25 [Bacteroidales bacterium]